MRRQAAWPSMLIAGLLLACFPSARCAAQSQAAAPEVSKPAPAKPPQTPLASTVSPAIERFLKASGQATVAPADPRLMPTRMPQATSGVQPPLPAPSSPSSRTAQDVRQQPTSSTSTIPPPVIPRPRVATPEETSPLATNMRVRPAPAERTDLRFPMNLATALRLSDARPLIVAAAQASVWVAEADLTHARVLWVPALNVAADYIRHDGGGPDFNKGVMTAPSVNFFYAGAGLWGFIGTTDAIFEPMVARQDLNSRKWDIQSAKNDALMQTADAYFRVHQYRGTYAGMLYCVQRGHDLVERLATLSRDLVSEFEVQRARNLLADIEQRAVLSRQEWRVASADLTQLLRLDPRALVEPEEPDHLQITIVEPARTLEELMPIAISNRPEIASRRALVQSATARIRREKMRPFLPNFILSGYQTPGGMLIQGGIFSIGPNSSLGPFVGRDDVSVQLIWQIEYMGIGNLARIKRQRGEQSGAIMNLYRTQDGVAADVTRALARVQSAALRVIQADRSLRTGIINFNGNLEGLGQTSRFANMLILINRPQEVVFSLGLVRIAFDEYYSTVAEYNRAQFDLYHALGYPAYEIALRNPPGDVRPIDVTRPRFLPPVGNGPPQATR